MLSALFAGPPYGIGMLTAGLILAIMVLPFVTAICATCSTPFRLCEKLAGQHRLHHLSTVVPRRLLHARRRHRRGDAGARPSAGETMAVTFVIGNAHKVSGLLLAPGTTISATIANEFTEAVGDIYTSLIALGLILFVITFIVPIARYLRCASSARIVTP